MMRDCPLALAGGLTLLAVTVPAAAQTVPDDPALAAQQADVTIVEGEQRPPSSPRRRRSRSAAGISH